MSSADIARLIMEGMKPPEGNNDIGWAQGEIISWDELSGVNTIRVFGQDYNNISSLQSGVGVLYQPGDKVGMLRFQTTYFVLGKIAAPGAGAASQIRSAEVATGHNVGVPTTYGDLPTLGPTLNNVYIGSSRRCLVMVSAYLEGNQSFGNMSFQVSGASSIAPSTSNAAQNGTLNAVTVGNVSTRVKLLTSGDGLNQGFNTFQAKYLVEKYGTGTGAIFAIRSLTVIPF